MIETLPSADRYNVAQLHYALTDDTKHASGVDALGFDVNSLQPPLSGAASPPLLHTPHSSDAETDYSSRRMSSSAASDSSLQSRPDKRSFDFSPSASPVPKKSRPEPSADAQGWSPADHDDGRSELGASSTSPRVQLPSLASTFQDRHELRRASLPSSLHDTGSNRLRLPAPGHRASQSHSLSSSPQSGLSSYQFPLPHENGGSEERRLRLATDTQAGGLYNDYPDTALSGPTSFSFSGGSPQEGTWASSIARPSSTPGGGPGAPSPSLKYDDPRASSSGLYGGVTRISGQHHASDRARAPGIKTESEWAFSSQDFPSMAHPAATSPSGLPAPAAPAIAVTASPQRSPQAPAPASLVERPPRKRGKLPKPVTDYLKDWLHRHSDHPYPSEEEKKQLCNATGLSMSQVSNWMINARRRILAPAHRAAAGPQTNMPYATPRPSVLDTGRRASMPADSLTLYHPMSLQSLPEYGGLSSTRHMVGLTRSMSSSHASVGALANSHGHHPYSMDAYHGRLSYGAGGALHPSSHVAGGAYLGVPMSAPASLSGGNPFLGGGSLYSSGSGASYNPRVSPDGHSGGRYAFPDHGHSVSPQPGSGYTTPH